MNELLSWPPVTVEEPLIRRGVLALDEGLSNGFAIESGYSSPQLEALTPNEHEHERQRKDQIDTRQKESEPAPVSTRY
jgi:hypothetical protein